jgi:hyperosmotically inducible protein
MRIAPLFFVPTHHERRLGMTVFKLVGAAMVAAALVLSGCATDDSKRSAGQFGSDAALTSKVKTAIATDAGLGSATAVNVQSYRGVVQLSGFVDSQDKVDRAAKAARAVEGVRSVENNIRVRPSS